MPSLHLKGPDAADFLHRITTADVRALRPGSGIRAAILAPTGRYEASFHLWRDAPDAFTLETWGGQEWKDRLVATLDRYTFAEKMKWEPAMDSVSPKFPAPENEDRIASLLPYPGFEITLERNPLEVGDGASVAHQKGCYPGQEVIEKIRALGAPAKRLVRVRSVPSLETTNDLPLLDPESGTEVGVLTTDGGARGLAILRKTHARVGAKLVAGSRSFEVDAVSEDSDGSDL